MIAHLHVRFNLLNAAHPVQRDVLVPAQDDIRPDFI